LDDGYRLRIKEKNYAGRQEDRLKTANAERTIELHSSVAQLLREHIGTRKTGWAFKNKKHKPLCASNLLKRVLHPILVGGEKKPGVTGTKAGEHTSAAIVMVTFAAATARLDCSNTGLDIRYIRT
jgi:hypothetical protein